MEDELVNTQMMMTPVMIMTGEQTNIEHLTSAFVNLFWLVYKHISQALHYIIKRTFWTNGMQVNFCSVMSCHVYLNVRTIIKIVEKLYIVKHFCI